MKLKAIHFWSILLIISFLGLFVSGIVFASILKNGARIALWIFVAIFLVVLLSSLFLDCFENKKRVFWLIGIVISFIGIFVSGIYYAAANQGATDIEVLLRKTAIIFLGLFATMFFAVLLPPLFIDAYKNRKWVFFAFSLIIYIGILDSLMPFIFYKYVVENATMGNIALGFFVASLIGLVVIFAVDDIINKVKQSKKISEQQKHNETDKTDNGI